MSIKKQFNESIKHMYPPDKITLETAQLRDVIRVYCMGWADALRFREDRDGAAIWLMEMEMSGMMDPTWQPDDSWKIR